MLRNEAAPGLVLMACAAIALILANSPLSHPWHEFFHHLLPWSPVAKLDTLHLWINDGLMAVFFFVVGLEIKRELVDGRLSTWDKRRLPVIAAIAGALIVAMAGGARMFQLNRALKKAKNATDAP